MIAAPTGPELQAAARRAGLTQAEIARATGLSIRTVNRLLNMAGSVSGRATSINAIAALLGLREPVSAGALPLMAIELPLGIVDRARNQLSGLYELLSAARSTRWKSRILDRLSPRTAPRTSVVALRDDDVYYEWIGPDIRWSGRHIQGQRTLSLPDTAVGQVATERYWKALFTGEPVCQYVRTPQKLSFTVLTVPVQRPTGPGLITASALGRPPVVRQDTSIDSHDR